MGTLLKARDLSRPEFKANPYPFYARLRTEEPVCRISAIFMNAWLVTRYDGEFSPGFPFAYIADPDGYEIEIWFE